MGKPGDIIVALDIGTTKTCAVVGEVVADGVDITGVGESRSRGLRKGVVVNIESTVASIKEAVERAGNVAGVQIASVYAGLAGSHVRGVNSHGIVTIAGREVAQDDVGRVLDQAQHIQIPGDRRVIHVLPQDYIVDAQDGIREPIGMAGVRLEARAHLITAAETSIQNLTKCADRCQLHMADLVLSVLASAEAVVTEDEKEIGVAVVDIGGGTTDVILYVDGSVAHTAVLPMGGMNLTADIAAGLRTPTTEAERLKLRYGCAVASLVDPTEMIEVPGVGGRAAQPVSRQLLANIAEPRMEEIFRFVGQVIMDSGYRDLLGAGVVICGGGSILEGTPELAEHVLGLPTRRGEPTGVGGLVEMVRSPSMATAVGLLKWGASRPARPMVPPVASSRPGPVKVPPGQASKMTGTLGRIKDWISEVF